MLHLGHGVFLCASSLLDINANIVLKTLSKYMGNMEFSKHNKMPVKFQLTSKFVWSLMEKPRAQFL